MADDSGSAARFRENSRAPLEVPAEVQVDAFSDPLTGRTANVSKGGLFLTLRDPLPVGSLVRFRLQLGDPPTTVEGTGEVVWIRAHGEGPNRPAGIGVQFRYLDDQGSRLLRIEVEKALERMGPEPEIPPTRRLAPSVPSSGRTHRPHERATPRRAAAPRRPGRSAKPSPRRPAGAESSAGPPKQILGMPAERAKIILLALLFGALALALLL